MVTTTMTTTTTMVWLCFDRTRFMQRTTKTVPFSDDIIDFACYIQWKKNDRATFGNVIPLDENAFTPLYTCHRERLNFSMNGNKTLHEWKNNMAKKYKKKRILFDIRLLSWGAIRCNNHFHFQFIDIQSANPNHVDLKCEIQFRKVFFHHWVRKRANGIKFTFFR